MYESFSSLNVAEDCLKQVRFGKMTYTYTCTCLMLIFMKVKCCKQFGKLKLFSCNTEWRNGQSREIHTDSNEFGSWSRFFCPRRGAPCRSNRLDHNESTGMFVLWGSRSYYYNMRIVKLCKTLKLYHLSLRCIFPRSKNILWCTLPHQCLNLEIASDGHANDFD